jgi:hypothetical protein
MNLGFYIEKLHSSDEFADFQRENPGAYLCSGFFVIDREKSDHKIHFDYISPESKKISSFQMENGIRMANLEKMEGAVLEEISHDLELDFDELEEVIWAEMEKNNIKSKIQKIMLSLQKSGGKTFLAGTVFVSALGMIRLSILLPEKKITEFEKKSFFDIVNVFRK